ncbi:MAG: ArsR/SmtB family transcription factor [Pirellulaceae bacterium]
MEKRPELYLIRQPEEAEAAFSPIRNQIRLAMEMLGESTVNEIASHLGRSAESLYYHFRILQKAGLVQVAGQQADSGRAETVYRLRAKRIRVDATVRARRFRVSLGRIAGTLLRFAERCYLRAIQDGNTVVDGNHREVRLIQVSARLSRARVIELNRKLLELESFLETADDPRQSRRFVLTMVLSPGETSAD